MCMHVAGTAADMLVVQDRGELNHHGLSHKRWHVAQVTQQPEYNTRTTLHSMICAQENTSQTHCTLSTDVCAALNECLCLASQRTMSNWYTRAHYSGPAAVWEGRPHSQQQTPTQQQQKYGSS